MAVRRWVISLAGVAGMASWGAFADPIMECPGGSQVEIGKCLSETAERATLSLQTALDIARDAASELDNVTGRVSALPALEKSHAAWAEYLQSHCDYVGATFGGGSGTRHAIHACRIELTRERVNQLMGSL